MNRFYLHKNNSTLTGFFSECAKNLERLKIKKIGIKIGNDEELSMELLQLEYFYAVAKTQHVTHTAEQLHIAQPASPRAFIGWKKNSACRCFTAAAEILP